MRKYEAMLLFDPMATTEWEAIQQEVDRILERAGARPILVNKWDERRLAYEIKGRKRGIYVLTYFEAPPGAVDSLESDCRLSEMILRAMVIRADHLSEEEMQEIAARPVAQEEGPPRRDRREEGDRERERDRRRAPRESDNKGSESEAHTKSEETEESETTA